MARASATKRFLPGSSLSGGLRDAHASSLFSWGMYTRVAHILKQRHINPRRCVNESRLLALSVIAYYFRFEVSYLTPGA